MDVQSFREYCLSKTGAYEEFPFGEETLVFKIMGKMFALAGLDHIPFRVSLKCDPDRAIELRDQYPDVISGAYHLNKKHWNSLVVSQLPPALVLKLIDHSYDLVISGLTKKDREELIRLNSGR